MTSALAFGRWTHLAATAALVSAAGCASAPAWMQNGMKAPPLDGRTVDGQTVSLAAERGKVAVVVFFSDYCPFCRGLYPTERELATRMNGNPFVVIGVDGGDAAETLRDAAHRERISWPVVYDVDGALGEAWGVTRIPTVYVLDADGVIRAFNPSSSALIETVDDLIARTKTAK
jgi:peroxiredoxin